MDQKQFYWCNLGFIGKKRKKENTWRDVWEDSKIASRGITKITRKKETGRKIKATSNTAWKSGARKKEIRRKI